MTLRLKKKNEDKQTRVRNIVFGTNGLKLRGQVTLPAEASAESPVPGVLLCHGFGASHKAMKPSAEILSRYGIATMVFDFRGHCSSEGVVDGKMVDDIIDAWNVFKDYPEIDKSKMGLVGHSMGAMSSIIAAENLENSRVLVALSCPPSIDKSMMDNNLPSNFGHWGNERSRIMEYPRQGAFPWLKGVAALGCCAWMYFFGYSVRVDIPKFFSKVLEMNMLDALSKLKDCSKLFVFCEGDSVTPYAQSVAVYEAATDPKALMLSKGGFHTTPLMRSNVRDQWTNWIAEELTR